MTSSARLRPRWLLHPLTVVLVLLGAGGWATFAAATAPPDRVGVGSLLLLVGVAGAAAGFANSGST